jgi:hypothetical protein
MRPMIDAALIVFLTNFSVASHFLAGILSYLVMDNNKLRASKNSPARLIGATFFPTASQG